MRYVSHMKYTPLNSVSMGLAVLQAEIAQSMGDIVLLLQDEGSKSMLGDYDENTNNDTL